METINIIIFEGNRRMILEIGEALIFTDTFKCSSHYLIADRDGVPTAFIPMHKYNFTIEYRKKVQKWKQ